MTTLTQCQEKAIHRLEKFMFDDTKYLILDGAAGTGKSFILKHLKPNKRTKTLELLTGKDFPRLLRTATTKKAASLIKGNTIHSILGFRYDNVSKKFVPRISPSLLKIEYKDTIIIIDEASMLQKDILTVLDKVAYKVLFLGDSNQLPPVKEKSSIVFNKGIEVVSLNTLVRQTNKDLIVTISDFKDVIGTPYIPTIELSENVIWLDKDAFIDSAINSFNKQEDVSVITFTNKLSEAYQQTINEHVNKNMVASIGQELTVINHRNSRYVVTRKLTGERVEIPFLDNILVADIGIIKAKAYGTQIDIAEYTFNTKGNHYTIREILNLEEIAEEHRLTVLNHHSASILKRNYAQTVHKSQGSTYDTIYIDLDDFKLCRDNLQKLLYVAVSRARNKIVFTGDLV